MSSPTQITSPPAGTRPLARRLPRLSWSDLLYLPAIIKGLLRTLRRILFGQTFTVQYPEENLYEKHGYPGGENRRFRGEHILVKDEQGREKCVACMLCSAACPAVCITIVPEDAPWPDRDRRPKVFEIDMLKCIYCGFCEEACPCDAIRLTPAFYQISRSREEMLYDKDKLLAGPDDPRGRYQTPYPPVK